MGPARRPHSLGLAFRSLRRRALASGPDRPHAHPGAGLAVRSPGAEAPPGPEPFCRAEGPRPAPGWRRFRPARGPRRPGHGRGRSARGSGPGRRGGLGSAGGPRAPTRAGARPERGGPGGGSPHVAPARPAGRVGRRGRAGAGDRRGAGPERAPADSDGAAPAENAQLPVAQGRGPAPRPAVRAEPRRPGTGETGGTRVGALRRPPVI